MWACVVSVQGIQIFKITDALRGFRVQQYSVFVIRKHLATYLCPALNTPRSILKHSKVWHQIEILKNYII